MDPFKKFCISFAILIAFHLLVVHPIMFLANLGVEDAPGRTMDNWFKVKEAYARNSSKKLFVLGGSSILLGVDAAKIESELGITTVNFGTTVALRTYMFDRIKASLASGDIVLMPLEYPLYKGTRIDEDTFVYVLEYDKEYFNMLPFTDKLIFMHGIKFSFLAKRLVARAIRNEYGDDESKYTCSKYLNANGDITSNTYETKTYKKPPSPKKYNFSASRPIEKYMKQILSNFVEYCKNSYIKLYVTWQPMYSLTERKEFYGHDAEVVKSIRAFWEENNVPVLGYYKDALFDAENCYDSASHLNNRGRSKYTKHLIELIRPYI